MFNTSLPERDGCMVLSLNCFPNNADLQPGMREVRVPSTSSFAYLASRASTKNEADFVYDIVGTAVPEFFGVKRVSWAVVSRSRSYMR